MASKKRYRDGDKLHASVFNVLLDTVDNNSAAIEVLKKSIPTKTSQLINDSGFITKDTNTWRKIEIGGEEILGTGTNTKPLNLISGEGITISHDDNGNVTINSSGGGTSYIAGDNIEINGNVISAVDTKYTASDFDIKNLADSEGLREEWSGKQDPVYVDVDEVVDFLNDEY